MGIKKDSTRSFVILGMITFTDILEIAVIKGLSVLLPTLKEQLTSQTWIIGSSISIIYGWGYLLGMSAGPLKKRFGARLCIMFSGAASSAGLIVCALANDVYVLLLGLLLLGFLLLEENVAMGSIPEYFDEYYNVAINVTCFGTAIAIIVTPLLTQICFELYGWRGTLLIICGINMQSIVFGAFFQTRENIDVENDYAVREGTNNQQQTTLLRRLNNIWKAYDISMVTRLPFVARVLLPGMVYGYTFSAWLIYIVSYALSNGASLKESSIVATSGGIGIAAIRIVLPIMNRYMSYRDLIYISSLLMTLSMILTTVFTSMLGMCMSSVLYGISIGILGTEIYIAIRDIVREDQYVNGVAWFHLVDGFAMIIGATITGVLYDATESFTVSFIMLSAVSFGTSISLGLEDIWMKLREVKSAPI